MLQTSDSAWTAPTTVDSLPAPSCMLPKLGNFTPGVISHTIWPLEECVTTRACRLTAFGSIICLFVGLKWKHFRNPFLHLTPHRTVIFSRKTHQTSRSIVHRIVGLLSGLKDEACFCLSLLKYRQTDPLWTYWSPELLLGDSLRFGVWPIWAQ